MTSLSKALGDVFSDCKNWIAQNPSKVRTWETRTYIIAQILLGKFTNTKLQTEWLRSAYKLVSLFNGLIILHTPTKKPYDTAERVNICIAVLEYCEIALEKSAEQLLGIEGKWNIVKYLQIIKFLAKVTLVLHFKEKIICHPCAELENNLTIQPTNSSFEHVNFQVRSNNALRLRRSGRIMRTVASAPPLCSRMWKPPEMDGPVIPLLKDVDNYDKLLQTLGETLYIVKPIINLALIRKYGARSWKQWSYSLFLDILSLYCLTYPTDQRKKLAGLNPVEVSTVAQRRSNLMFYFIRSPFFQRKIATPLYLALYMIPFVGPVLSEELQFYLSSYFFLWSN